MNVTAVTVNVSRAERKAARHVRRVLRQARREARRIIKKGGTF